MEKDTPRCLVIQVRRSARILKSLGADLSPNGRQVSMYRDCFHSIVRRSLSAGCTGRRRNACLISTFARRVLGPVSMIFLIASSTVIYERLHRFLGMPSLTLWCLGYDRSVINRHLPGWLRLRITPNRLMWACLWDYCWRDLPFGYWKLRL